MPKYEFFSSKASVREWVSPEVMMANGRALWHPERAYRRVERPSIKLGR